MNRRRMSVRLRIQLVAFLMLLGMGALVFKLWLVQVAHGEQWTARIRSSSEATVRIPSIRGEIRDRNGLALVQNRASYEVDFYLPDMVRGYRQRFGRTPTTEYRGTISGMPKDLKEADVVKIVNTGIVPRLDDLDLARDYNSAQLQRHYRTNTEVPFTYLKDIDFKTMAKFSEHDVGLPGVDIAIKPVRSYVYGALASHLLGYVGAPDEPDRDEARKYTFYQGDVEGKTNIEKSMDQYLRGKPGLRVMRRNAKGQIDGVLREEPPQPGDNVYLTIDARIQYVTEEALRAVGRGAAVVVDPNNGNILAMASVPSFDPNTFIPSIKAKDWSALRNDEAKPLINRAVSAFPPGSTFKLVTALAGLRKGMAKVRYNCGGGVTYGDHFFHCWIAEKGGSHGVIGLADAIKVSCNSYFYQFGNAAGIDAIDKTGAELGLGQESGINITGEQPGVLPGPEWMAIHSPREKWSQAYTANVSIGQGYDLVTPLQLAMVYSTVANGGISYYPRIIDKVIRPDGTTELNEKGEPVVPRAGRMHSDLRKDFTPDQIALARQGLWKVVNEDGGTGSVARMKEIVVAGKTGTAQASDRGREGTVAWFACFAPFDQPKYVVVVAVQAGEHGGHGGSVAGPIADRILKQVFAMDAGTYSPQVAWLEPAHSANPFQTVASVVYHDTDPTAGSSDEEGADNDSPGGAVQMASDTAAPDVQPEADAQGRVTRQKARVVRAQPVAAPTPRPNFFQRLFGGGRRQATPPPRTRPTPRRGGRL